MEDTFIDSQPRNRVITLKKTLYLGKKALSQGLLQALGRRPGQKAFLRTYFKLFRSRSPLEINETFVLSLGRLLDRAFFFLNPSHASRLARRGQVLLNFGPCRSTRFSLGPGDMVSLVISSEVTAYLFLRCKQQGRLLHRARVLLKNNSHQPSSRDYKRGYPTLPSTLRNLSFRRLNQPTWMEVDYLSMSFFIIRPPILPGFKSTGFNPYLYRLVELR